MQFGVVVLHAVVIRAIGVREDVVGVAAAQDRALPLLVHRCPTDHPCECRSNAAQISESVRAGFTDMRFVSGVVRDVEGRRHGEKPGAEQAGPQSVVQVRARDLDVALELQRVDRMAVEPVRLAVGDLAAGRVVGGDEGEAPCQRQTLEVALPHPPHLRGETGLDWRQAAKMDGRQ